VASQKLKITVQTYKQQQIIIIIIIIIIMFCIIMWLSNCSRLQNKYYY